MSDYKPGEIIGVSRASAYPNCADEGEIPCAFCASENIILRIFIMQGLGTPGRVAAKSIALILKEANKNGSSKRQENQNQT